MSLYAAYLEEIENRKTQGLSPKPIDDGALLQEIIAQIKDDAHEHRADSLHYLIYNTLPGTTNAAGVKAAFLKEIITGAIVVPEITVEFAYELLSHMKGGPSIAVLLDLALGADEAQAQAAAQVMTGLHCRCTFGTRGMAPTFTGFRYRNSVLQVSRSLCIAYPRPYTRRSSWKIPGHWSAKSPRERSPSAGRWPEARYRLS